MHDGAIATAMDQSAGIATKLLGIIENTITLNLSIQYYKPIPLGPSGIIVKIVSRLASINGKKVKMTASIMNGDTSDVYATATALYYNRAPESLGNGEPAIDDANKKLLAMVEVLKRIESKTDVRHPVPVHIDPATAQGIIQSCPMYADSVPVPYNLDKKPGKSCLSYTIGNPKLYLMMRVRHGKGGGLTGVAAVSREVNGPPGGLHGGCICTLLLSAAAAYASASGVGRCPKPITKISVDYKKITPIDATYTLAVKWVRIEGPIHHFEATLRSLDRQTVYAVARGESSEQVPKPAL